MALVYRNSKPYYYRSLRVVGKATKQYVASGAMAELVADVDRLTRERRHEREEAERRSRQRLKQADRLISTLERQSALLVHATLHANGYHQHKRTWRLKRDQAA